MKDNYMNFKSILTGSIISTLSACSLQENLQSMSLDAEDKALENFAKLASEIFPTSQNRTFFSLPKNESSLDWVLLLGETGVGKSTFFNLLSNKEVRLNNDETLSVLSPLSSISSGSHSETEKPFYFEMKPYIFWDCPGFFDTRGYLAEIKNILAIQKIVQNANRIKFLLLIDFKDLKGRTNNLIKIFEYIMNLFKTSTENFSKKSSIIITKVPINCQKVDIINKMRDLIELFSIEDEKKFIKNLLRNDIIIFYKSDNLKELKKETLAALEKINHNSVSFTSIAPIVSPEGQEQLLKIFKIIIRKYERLLDSFTIKIISDQLEILKKIHYESLSKKDLLESEWYENFFHKIKDFLVETQIVEIPIKCEKLVETISILSPDIRLKYSELTQLRESVISEMGWLVLINLMKSHVFLTKKINISPFFTEKMTQIWNIYIKNNIIASEFIHKQDCQNQEKKLQKEIQIEKNKGEIGNLNLQLIKLEEQRQGKIFEIQNLQQKKILLEIKKDYENTKETALR